VFAIEYRFLCALHLRFTGGSGDHERALLYWPQALGVSAIVRGQLLTLRVIQFVYRKLSGHTGSHVIFRQVGLPQQKGDF